MHQILVQSNEKACQRSPFGAKMWNSRFFFSIVVLIQNTLTEKSLTDNNSFPKKIDRWTNDLSYLFLCFEENFLFFSFFTGALFLFAVLLFNRYLFSFFLS